jgi:hypothetical protein
MVPARRLTTAYHAEVQIAIDARSVVQGADLYCVSSLDIETGEVHAPDS